jgi:uncharacterized membrane protein YhaH (DUF805 family)
MNNDNYNIEDKFLREKIKEIGLMEAPPSILINTMSKIQAKPLNKEVFSYKPLISKQNWLGIILSLTIIAIITANATLNIQLPKFSFDFSHLSLELSPKIVFPILIFGLVVFINAILLSRKRVG